MRSEEIVNTMNAAPAGTVFTRQGPFGGCVTLTKLESGYWRSEDRGEQVIPDASMRLDASTLIIPRHVKVGKVVV